MKKIGYLLSFIGIVLIIVSVSLSSGSINNSNKKVDIPDATKSKKMKSITLKHHNRFNPSVLTFNFSEELSCNSKNDYEFDCSTYSRKENAIANLTIRASTLFNSSTSLNKLIDNFKNLYKRDTLKVSDISICKGDIICAKKDEVVNYEGGKFGYYQTEVAIYLSHGDGYYTSVYMYLSDYNNDKNHDTRVNNYVNEFVKSIKIDKYVEEEKKYKDDKLAITLYTPRFNETSKINIYLDKNKYTYPDSLYEYTNDKVTIYHSKTKITGELHVRHNVIITYLYSEKWDGNKNESDLERFATVSRDVSIVPDIAEKVTIAGKELYHNKNNNGEYLYIINDNYALGIRSSTEIEEDLIKDIINFEYVK